MANARKVEAVADASFLIAMQWLGLLETLETLYSRVLVPNRVWEEFCAGCAVKDYLHILREKGFFLSDQLVNEVLSLTGEQ